MILAFKSFPIAVGIKGGLMRAPKVREERFHRTKEGGRIAKEGEVDTEKDKPDTWHHPWVMGGEESI